MLRKIPVTIKSMLYMAASALYKLIQIIMLRKYATQTLVSPTVIVEWR